MEIGDILLYLALISGALALILHQEKISHPLIDRLVPHRRWSVRLCAASLTLAVLLLARYFLISDFYFNYVYSYSSLDLAPIYKLSALWTGEEGSMLFFTWGLVLVAAYLYEKRPKGHERTIVLVLALLMLLITISLGPFTPTLQEHPDYTELPQDGLGLNPLLVNIWMVFHPPGIFIGYVLMAVIFASAVLKSQKWEAKSRNFARWAWLILGAGIISGCIWSYEVWESYWIWDPAFTSSLMVWLMLTAYLHTAARFRKSGELTLLAPSMGVMSFVLALYSVYIIRSGTIQSVHSFGAGGKSMILLYLVTVMFIMSVVLFIKWATSEREAASQSGDMETQGILSDSTLFLVTIVLFILLSAVLFTGLSFTLILDIFGQGVAVSVALFNDWSFPLTVLLVAVMGLCMFPVNYRKHTLVLAVILAIAFVGINITGDRYDDVSSAAITFAVVGGLYRIIKEITSRYSPRARLRLASPHLIHLGIAIMLVGVLMSTYYTSETVYFRSFNEKKAVGDFEIQLTDLTFPVQHEHYTATLNKIGTYNIYRANGSLIATGYATFTEIDGEYVTRPFIYKGLLSDVRVTYQGIGTTTPIFISFVNIMVVPGMSVIWLGCILILLGILPRIFVRRKSRKLPRQ